jgi:hypothetical protein
MTSQKTTKGTKTSATDDHATKLLSMIKQMEEEVGKDRARMVLEEVFQETLP